MSDAVTAADAARAALAVRDGGPAVAVATVVDGPDGALGRRLLLENGERRGTLGSAALDDRAADLAHRTLERGEPETEQIQAAGESYVLYLEPLLATEELVVVGAGHIAVPLARLGVLLGFETTVLDDREEFATPERFPTEARVIRADFSDPFRGVDIGPRSHLVLVTRAHKYDFDCLRRLAERERTPAYIGMIGSRRRVKAAFHALLEYGIPRERLAPIHAPVGLDIGAETPEEIAVSIAAEIIRIRRGASDVETPRPRRGVSTLSQRERVLDRLVPDHG